MVQAAQRQARGHEVRRQHVHRHVWTAPTVQGFLSADGVRELAVMYPAFARGLGLPLATMECASRVPFILTGSKPVTVTDCPGCGVLRLCHPAIFTSAISNCLSSRASLPFRLSDHADLGMWQAGS